MQSSFSMVCLVAKPVVEVTNIVMTAASALRLRVCILGLALLCQARILGYMTVASWLLGENSRVARVVGEKARNDSAGFKRSRYFRYALQLP